ncbi:hypothetical protein PRIPAC_81410 [Pristionchus pacificus]|uniref:G protein-coupled receptor n=1 Tax=Pristionchus pacificus TaxID=54126 RepID=A0A2A6CK97_PRIPA|nr:hypothetical protein PRIPAC_81410 [Pristionchus pacificus]|eukprot:PDM78526.1 G protein-coupled receptor [Pristionchus pacificus]
MLLYVCCYTHLAVAINRFFSVYFPLRYLAAKSGKSKTIMIISLVVMAALIQSSPLSLVSDCYFIYDGASSFWLFADTESCQFFETYIDFSLSATFFCIIICIDAASFVMIQKTLNKLVIGASNDKRNNNEMLFFKQSISQMLTYLVGFFFFDIVSRISSNEWVIFLSTTFTWSVFHAVEGIVMVYFQTRLLIKRSKSEVIEMSVSASTAVRTYDAAQRF